MADVVRINALMGLVGFIASALPDLRGILPYFAAVIFYLPLELLFRKRQAALL
jgi:hypothetical protein